jgi:hypothetical protein
VADEVGDERSEDRKDDQEDDEAKTGERDLVSPEPYEKQLPWSLADIGFADNACLLFKRRDYVGCSQSHSSPPFYYCSRCGTLLPRTTVRNIREEADRAQR